MNVVGQNGLKKFAQLVANKFTKLNTTMTSYETRVSQLEQKIANLESGANISMVDDVEFDDTSTWASKEGYAKLASYQVTTSGWYLLTGVAAFSYLGQDGLYGLLPTTRSTDVMNASMSEFNICNSNNNGDAVMRVNNLLYIKAGHYAILYGYQQGNTGVEVSGSLTIYKVG